MREYGKLKTSFWSNPRVRSLSDEAKLLYTYLIACPHGNSIGCFVLPSGYIMEDMGWVSERVSKRVSELVEKGLIERDDGARIVRVIGWWDHNTIDNGKVAMSAVKTLIALPKCPAVLNAFNEIVQFGSDGNRFVNEYRYELENEFANWDGYNETETETETETPHTPKKLAEAPDPRFVEFWELFPRTRRGSKADALNRWKAAIKTTSPDAIIAGLHKYIAGSDVARGFASAADVWLNKERWNDDPAPAASHGKPQAPPLFRRPQTQEAIAACGVGREPTIPEGF